MQTASLQSDDRHLPSDAMTEQAPPVGSDAAQFSNIAKGPPFSNLQVFRSHERSAVHMPRVAACGASCEKSAATASFSSCVRMRTGFAFLEQYVLASC